MSLSPANLAILKNELATDPNKLGYATLLAKAGDHAVAKILNSSDTANQVPVKISRRQAKVVLFSTGELHILATPDSNFLSSFSPEDAALVKGVAILMTDADFADIDFNDPIASSMLQKLADIDLVQQSTVDTLKAISHRNGSRAEVLFGSDIIVLPEDVGACR